MTDKLILNKNLVFFFKNLVNRDEAIMTLASLLETGGYVKGSFSEAVIEREKVFPTGLPTQSVGIAIPHTDAEHVNRGAMAVGILSDPVVFDEMGNLESTVDVSIIFMLAIANPDMLISVLRKLATTFQDKEFLSGLKFARIEDEVLGLYKQVAPDVVDSGEM